jgi:hypothetical protein
VIIWLYICQPVPILRGVPEKPPVPLPAMSQSSPFVLRAKRSGLLSPVQSPGAKTSV